MCLARQQRVRLHADLGTYHVFLYFMLADVCQRWEWLTYYEFLLLLMEVHVPRVLWVVLAHVPLFLDSVTYVVYVSDVCVNAHRRLVAEGLGNPLASWSSDVLYQGTYAHDWRDIW